MIKKCIICEKDYNVRGKRKEVSKYCSKECKGRASRSYRKCANCNEDYYGFNRGETYCSRECGEEGRRKYEVIRCSVCDNTFYPSHKEQNSCSVKCGNESRKRHQVEFSCIECNKPFKKHRATVKQREHEIKFCSIECRNSNWRKDGWSKLKEMNKLQQLHKPTKLELLGYSILDELGINYIPQFEVKDKFLVDAFIPSLHLIIQFDGDYWHGNPTKYSDLTERQMKQIKKDRSQDKYLKTCGYNLVRIWESDLKKDKQIIERLLEDEVQKK